MRRKGATSDWNTLLGSFGEAVLDSLLAKQSGGALPPMQSPRERREVIKEAEVLAVRTEPLDPDDP